jgi:hypothetical protein
MSVKRTVASRRSARMGACSGEEGFYLVDECPCRLARGDGHEHSITAQTLARGLELVPTA